MLRALINGQIWLSRRFDRLLPAKYRTDGNTDFRQSFALAHIAGGVVVYDIGSGRHPFLSPERKRELRARVVGLDIDPAELAAAPSGCYDDAICSDVTAYRGAGDADVVICQSLLEHVQGVEQALVAISSALKPGGVALMFVPSRNAPFARLNLLLPQRLKLWLLHTIYPHTRVGYGFLSFYDRCTPREFHQMARAAGLEVEELRCYYKSGYFAFCTPLHVLYRLWNVVHGTLRPQQGAETFSMALRKPVPGVTPP